jgi:hypothetical protein
MRTNILWKVYNIRHGIFAMDDDPRAASINTAIRNARLICYETGCRPNYDNPAFRVAMDVAYRIDDLLCGSEMPRVVR